MCVIAVLFLSVLKNEKIETIAWIGLIPFAVFVVPTMIIHANYYLVSRGDVLKYNFVEQTITLRHNNKWITFHLEDIDFAVRYMSFNLAANRSSVLLWDGYNHTVISLKSGEMLTVTSLLVPNLNLPIDQKKITIKRGFYRLAKRRYTPEDIKEWSQKVSKLE